MKKTLSLLLPAAVLCLAALVACNKEKGAGDAIYSIALDKTELQLALDETYTLTATVPSSDQTVVVWESSDPDIVSVNGNGMLTAVKDEGEATITAILMSRPDFAIRGSATCTVRVVTNYSLSLDHTSVKMDQNEKLVVKAIPTPSSNYGRIYWSCDKSHILILSEYEGEQTTFKANAINGKATVTAQLLSRFDGTVKARATCEVEVESYYVSKLNLPEDLYLVVDEEFQLNPKIEPEEAKDTPLTYSVTTYYSNVSVDETGKVKALKAHSAGTFSPIKVTSTDDKKYSETVRVHVDPVPVYPTSASLTGFQDETYVGKGFNTTVTYAHSGTGTPNQHGTTTVTSSKTSVATVTKTASGFSVTPLATGSTTITVTYHTSKTTTKSLSATLTVFSEPASLDWTDDQEAALLRGMVIGETLTVKAAMSNTNYKTVVYTSSDESVATVNATTGLITAKGRGWAYIKATSVKNPALTKITKTFSVYGVPATITCTKGDANPIFLRYEKNKEMSFMVRDADGNYSRQDLTVTLSSGLGNIYASSEVTQSGSNLTLANRRTSATSTIKGTMTLSATGYPSAKLTYDLYDAMYDKYDIKPFDGIDFLDNGAIAPYDGGYRGSGYFENITFATGWKDCSAVVFWVGEHPSSKISMRKKLIGGRYISSRPFTHGLAVAVKNARKSAEEDLVKWWTVSQKQNDAVNWSENYTDFWKSGNPGYGFSSVSTYNVRLYGYEITKAMKFYNEKVKSNAKYTVIPVKNIVDYMPDTYPENDYNTGWYLPTSGEWYMMLHCLDGATVSATLEKINEYIKKANVWTTIGGAVEYWSCQEADDDLDGSAVYMTGKSATAEGTTPALHKAKQETCKVRPFIAF